MSVTPMVDATVKDALVRLVANGTPLVEASAMVGLSKRSVDAMIRSDAEFGMALQEAHERMIAKVDRVVFEEAVDGNPKFAELFYRMHRPNMMAPATAAARAESAPQVAIAQMTVQIVQALVTGDHAPDFLDALHGKREAIEVSVTDDGDQPGD